MKIFIGADHNGFDLKSKLSEFLQTRGIEVVDGGNSTLDPGDDFPQFANATASALLLALGQGQDARGILICGGGQGMCMAANRFKGIRASLIWDEAEAHNARNDNDANVLCLPARVLTDFDKVTAIVDIWLNTPFPGAERFNRRNKELDQLG